ncbi:WD repeat and coiled-coil-containing protein-like [Asterias rubens]|uniref:WD repeat and coiled-coil-containing protein-like n=1 Tax=Asterias rubens TaxID=7604 RepID=UPI0014550776|nr:WD repeat and coiled-coil-containing protein-like [Asterias rubens]
MMFLGRGKSRRANVNHLQNAFHPVHGLVWSDGEHVNLSSISVNQDEITACPPTTLGQFNSVEQVAWSGDSTQCFLSVQHTRSITLWKVQLDKSQKLKLSRVKEIHEEAIPQGCMWHPTTALLLILSRDQLLLVDPEKDSVKTLPLNTHQRITAGVWSLDGSKVIVALGSKLIVCELDGNNQLVVDKTIQNFSGPIRKIVSVTPDIVAVTLDLPLARLLNQSKEDMFEATPFAEFMIKSTTEDCHQSNVLLESRSEANRSEENRSELKGQSELKCVDTISGVDSALTKEILKRSGPIDVTALFRRRGGGNQTSDKKSDSDCLRTQEESSKSGGDSHKEQESDLRSAGDKATSRNGDLRLADGRSGEVDLANQPEAAETIDLTSLRVNPVALGARPELKLKQKQQEPISESSQLVLVHLGRNRNLISEDAEESIISSLSLPCILNPDLLVYQRLSGVLVVGSNTQTKSYQASVDQGKQLRGRQTLDFNLSNHERPLGLCTVSNSKDLLLLTGEQSRAADITFLPSSRSSEYQLKLRKVKLKYDSS